MAAKTEATTEVHIFVGKLKVDFDTDTVTGRQIKEKAGVPLDHDLARRAHGQLELVTNEQTIEIKNGEHFEALPPGTISEA